MENEAAEPQGVPPSLNETRSDAGPASAAPFLRKASGVVREMSPRDGLFFGYLSAAGIYMYVLFLFVAAATFPEANYFVAIMLDFVIFTFVFGVYALLSSSMPRSGGDYVFVSRILSPRLGFTVAIAIWTLFNCFGAYFAASALINAILSPLFNLIGVATGSHLCVELAGDVTKAGVRLPLIVLAILGAGYIMANGMSIYVKAQKYLLMPIAILGLVIIVLSMLLTSNGTFFNHFDHFQGVVGGLKSNEVIPKAKELGFHPGSGASLIQTFGVAGLLSAVFPWSMWSVQLMGEIKSASKTKSMFRMFMGSHILVTVTALVGFVWAYHYVGETFMKAFSWMALNNPEILGGGWEFRGVPTFFYLPTLSLFVGILVFIGFAGPISQSLFNTILGPSRMLMAISFDRMLPAAFGKVNRKGVPHIAIWFLIGLCIAWTFAAELDSNILNIFFWGVFMTIIALLIAMIAGTVMPSTRKAIYAVAPAAQYRFLGVPLITVLGLIAGLGLAGIAADLLLDKEAFGLLEPGPARVGMFAALGAVVVCLGGFELTARYRASRGILVQHAFEEIPPA
jgi:APA family basic amino acid/polyamine antiporter